MPASTLNLVEVAAVFLTAPFLLFPTLRPGLTAIALALLVAVWIWRWAARRETWPLTPMNGALLLFCLTIPVGVWASPLLDLTIPKLTGLILGLAVFRVCGFAIRSERSLAWGLMVFGLVGLGILAAGIIGTQWQDKVAVLGPVVRRLPHAPIAGTDIHPNELAGALLLFLPVAAACALVGMRNGKRSMLAVGLFGLILSGGALLLTQSRSGWAGAAIGLWVLTLLWAASDDKPGLRRAVFSSSILLTFALIAGVLYVNGTADGMRKVLTMSNELTGVASPVGQLSIAGRIEVWSRAVYAIQDFPFTGLGLGAFRRVVHVLYPLFLTAPDFDLGHAHDMFLQTALDLGLPGLVAYLAILLTACITVFKVARHGTVLCRAVAFGALAGLIGLHIYGLTDALALGSKPGVAFWAVLGLLGAMAAPRFERQ